MKKLLLLLAALAVVLPASAQVLPDSRSDANGTLIGLTATRKVGFHGKKPVVQDANTVTPFQSLVNHGFLASGTDYSVQHATIPVSSANILGMYAAPVQILAAPGAGKTIVVDRVFVRLTRTATAYAAGGPAIFQYGNTANGAGTNAVDSTMAAAYITGASGVSEAARNGAVLSDQGTALQNQGLFISNTTAAFTTGTGTAVVDVWYHVF